MVVESCWIVVSQSPSPPCVPRQEAKHELPALGPTLPNESHPDALVVRLQGTIGTSAEWQGSHWVVRGPESGSSSDSSVSVIFQFVVPFFIIGLNWAAVAQSQEHIAQNFTPHSHRIVSNYPTSTDMMSAFISVHQQLLLPRVRNARTLRLHISLVHHTLQPSPTFDFGTWFLGGQAGRPSRVASCNFKP